MTARQAIAFVRRRGIVLEAAHVSGARVPSLADAIAGARVRGSWWSHPRGKQIFALTRGVRDSADVLVCRLVGGKITYVHRRLWPAVVRMAREIGPRRLDAFQERHTASGKHVIRLQRFPSWVPAGVTAAAKRLAREQALGALHRGGVQLPHERSIRKRDAKALARHRAQP
ncbi:MAG TPA: hypothetical protein VKH42_12455 [Vicinamibacterales bacterium]|nr:hypothetical protein [Vicinamibacterales bacterium]